MSVDCPLCGQPLEKEEWHEGGVLVETFIECPDCEFSLNWSYGLNDLVIGEKEWSWRQEKDPPKEVQELYKEWGW